MKKSSNKINKWYVKTLQNNNIFVPVQMRYKKKKERKKRK